MKKSRLIIINKHNNNDITFKDITFKDITFKDII
jgi:hypothetical protein